MQSITHGVCAAVVLAGLAPCLAADDVEMSSADEDRAGRFEEYIEVNESNLPASNSIASKLDVPLRLSPITIGTVGSAMIREQRSVVLGDVLRNVSGVNAQAGSGVFDNFAVRGFDAVDNGMLMIDGAREPEVSFYNLYNVDSVEILKGSAGFLYGIDPLAGVVNIVRKQPLPSDFAGLSVTASSHDTYEGAVDWNISDDTGDLAFRLNGVWNESENFRDGKDSRHLALNPSLHWQVSPKSTLNFNLEYVDAEYQPDAGLPVLAGGAVADVSRRRSYQTPFDSSEQEVYRFQLDFEHRLNDRVTLRNKSYSRGLNWDTTGTLFVSLDADGDGVFFNPGTSSFQIGRTVTVLDDRQRFSGNQFEAVIRLDGANVKHTLLAGLELAFRADDFSIDVAPPDGTTPAPGIPAIDLENPVETTVAITAFPFIAGDSEDTVISPYFIDQMQLSDKFQLLLGARFDRIERQDPVNGVDRTDSEVSPLVGFVFAPSDTLSLYANAGRTFSPSSPRIVSDPLLGGPKPEEGNQFELGLRQEFLDGKLRTTYSMYQINRENVAIPDITGITQQAGDQQSRGFEFELAAEPLPGLRTFFNYAYNDSKYERFAEAPFPGGPGIDRTGNTPAFSPRNLASLWVTKSYKRGLGLAGGLRYVGEQFIAPNNAFEIDDHLLVDASVFCDFGGYRVKLNLKNLTDQDYEMRGFGATSVIPADGLTVSAGFEFRL